MSCLRNDIEYIIHCESDGTIIGPLAKGYAHMPGVRETLTHYSTWSMIFHPKSGTYGIQQKNPAKHDMLTGGKWDMGAAGHNVYECIENNLQPLLFDGNLQKEVSEEIGMEVTIVERIQELTFLQDHALGIIFEEFHYKTDYNNEWVGLGFITTPTKETNFADGEVINFKWLTPEELSEFLSTDDNHCHALEVAFEKAEPIRKELFS